MTFKIPGELTEAKIATIRPHAPGTDGPIVPAVQRLRDVVETFGWDEETLAEVSGMSVKRLRNVLSGRTRSQSDGMPSYGARIWWSQPGSGFVFSQDYLMWGQGPREAGAEEVARFQTYLAEAELDRSAEKSAGDAEALKLRSIALATALQREMNGNQWDAVMVHRIAALMCRHGFEVTELRS